MPTVYTQCSDSKLVSLPLQPVNFSELKFEITLHRRVLYFSVFMVCLSLPQDSCNAPARSCEMESAGAHVSHIVPYKYEVAEMVCTGL